MLAQNTPCWNVRCSTQLQFTRCEKASDDSNYCRVNDPFGISSNGQVIIKVNGSNKVASTSTRDHLIQLHDIGWCTFGIFGRCCRVVFVP